MKKMMAYAIDEEFKKIDGAIYVKGYCSDPWMSQFSGVGYSPVPFKMKAILRDGIVYIPGKRPKRKRIKPGMTFVELMAQCREESYIEWIEARIQPPAHSIVEVN